MSRSGLLAGLVVAATAGCGKGGGAAPPIESRAFPSDTLLAEWAQIPLAAPFGSGRWVVVAADWDAAMVADFGAKTLTPLGGSSGSGGKRFYVHPFGLFAAGDTIYLSDWGGRRTTVWSPEGKLLDSIPAADPLRGSYPRGRDAAGQLYFEVPPIAGPDGRGNGDSAAIVRAPRSLARFDTVARLAPLEILEMRRENASRFEPRVYGGKDLWGVWRDGTVWIARVRRNQIVSIDPRGSVRRGPELPDPVYEVEQADRDRYLQGFPADVRPNETDIAFALIYPPFAAAFTTGDSLIWLEKSKTVRDSLRRIHTVDRGGNLLRVFQLTGQGRVIAIGAGAMLVAEQYASGVRLMQVRIPAPPPR